MTCQLCQQQKESEYQCAFYLGYFSSVNWGCGTMLRLRNLAEMNCKQIYSDDEYALLLPVEVHRDRVVFHFLLVGWYKKRGRTSECRFMDGEGRMHYPTESEILEVIG